MKTLIGWGLSLMAEYEIGMQLKEADLLERWKKSANLPRKQKKKERNHIASVWNTLQYSKSLFTI